MDKTIYNTLLNYQLREQFGLARVPAGLKPMLKGISDAYDCYERVGKWLGPSADLLSDKKVEGNNKSDTQIDTGLILAEQKFLSRFKEKEKGTDELMLANENLKKAEDQVRKLKQELEQKVMERTEQLQSANKELKSFSYTVSRDLRTPLAQLKLNKTLLARAEQVAQLGSWELNFTDNILRLSVEGSRIFGFPPDQNQLSFGEWSSLVHPDDLENVLQTIKESQETLINASYHHRIALRDGTIRHINSESKFEFDSDGNASGLYGTMQDVTEKIDEKQQREFEKSDKEALINNTDDAIWSVSRDFKLIAANKAFIRNMNALVGISLRRDDYLLNPDIYTPEFLALWKSFYERALKGEIFKEEVHIPAFSSGTETWFETSFNPIYTHDTVIGIACYSRNITERKLAEKLIRETEAKYRTFFETSMDGILLTDATGKIFTANPAACSIFLMTEAEICKAGREGIIDVTDPRLKPLLQQRSLTGMAKGELMLIRKDGTRFSSEITSSIYVDIQGHEKASIIIRDITERQKAQEIINESEQRYRSLFEEAADAICITDESLNFYDINPNGCRLLGYSKEEFLKLSVAELFFIEDLKANPLKIDDLKSGKAIRSDRRLKRKDGGIIEVDLSGKLMKDGRFIMFGRDITERKKAEAAILKSEAILESKNKELELKNKELEQFAFVASHDMQEPLRTTSSFAELLQKQYKGKLDQKADEYLSFITGSSDRMKVLIKDLLGYSRIGREKKLVTVDCNKLLQEVLADLGQAINETAANITADHLPVVNGYPSEIKQLFQNLVMNAVKFRKPNTVPRINICTQEKENYWEFTVSDNGIGIAKQHHEKIFIIFQRLHSRSEYEGSGIGLSHCKKIAELHGGKIWIESKIGEGTTFHFTILKNRS